MDKDKQNGTTLKCMKTSASAIENAKGCIRRWWFEKVHKLLEFETTPSKVQGDVLHGVCERFLNADDRGMDELGRPANLYPEDWFRTRNRWSGDFDGYSIDEGRQALVRTLVTKAIQEGILIRTPGRRIEKEFWLDVERGVHEGSYVQIHGFVDVCNPNGIEDHKTAGGPKYLKNPETLKTDIQMVIYALNYFNDNPGRDVCTLAHNQFITNVKTESPPQVRKTSTQITKEEALTFYRDNILPILAEMSRVFMTHGKKTKGFDVETLNKFTEVPHTQDAKNNCQWHYGKPCPFADVCNGGVTPKMFVDIKEQKTKKPGVTIMTDNSTPNVLMNLIGSAQPAQPVQPVQPPVQPTHLPQPAPLVMLSTPTAPPGPSPFQPPATPPVQPAAPTAPIQIAPAFIQVDKPMWASPGCSVCSQSNHPGFTDKREPCMVCHAQNMVSGGVTHDQCVSDVKSDGSVLYSRGNDLFILPPQTVTAKVKEPPLKQPVMEEKPLGVTTPPTPDTPLSKAVAATQPDANALPTQNPSNIYIPPLTLMIGCTYVMGSKSFMNTAPLSDILNDVLDKCDKSFNHFQKRDFIVEGVPLMIKDIREKVLGNPIVTQTPSQGSLLACLVETLIPFCDHVITPFNV
ncbi:MAG: PD-(D/E)XK nuclease family protein [Planctomycetes bacterium]|nr:PD-(D/E)XK nuclease family protein [Planctomycetota bacterium]